MSNWVDGEELGPHDGAEEEEVGAMLDRLEKEADATRNAASGPDLDALARVSPVAAQVHSVGGSRFAWARPQVGEKTTVAEGALSDLAGDLGEVRGRQRRT